MHIPLDFYFFFITGRQAETLRSKHHRVNLKIFPLLKFTVGWDAQDAAGAASH